MPVQHWRVSVEFIEAVNDNNINKFKNLINKGYNPEGVINCILFSAVNNNYFDIFKIIIINSNRYNLDIHLFEYICKKDNLKFLIFTLKHLKISENKLNEIFYTTIYYESKKCFLYMVYCKNINFNKTIIKTKELFLQNSDCEFIEVMIRYFKIKNHSIDYIKIINFSLVNNNNPYILEYFLNKKIILLKNIPDKLVHIFRSNVSIVKFYDILCDEYF